MKCIVCNNKAKEKYQDVDWCGDNNCGIKIQESVDGISECGDR